MLGRIGSRLKERSSSGRGKEDPHRRCETFIGCKKRVASSGALVFSY